MGLKDNIKRIRTEHDLTQEQFAQKIGVTRSTVTQWESGWSSPRMGAMEKISQVFNVPLTDLVKNRSDAIAERVVPNELGVIYHSLNTDARAKLLEYARDLAANPLNAKKDSEVQEQVSA